MNHKISKFILGVSILVLSSLSIAEKITLTVINNGHVSSTNQYSLYAYVSNSNKTLSDVVFTQDFFTVHFPVPANGETLTGIVEIPSAWVNYLTTTEGTLSKSDSNWTITLS